MSDRLQLGVPGFVFADLFNPARLLELDARFRHDLAVAPSTTALAERYEAWRAGGAIEPEAESELLLEVAPVFAGFVAKLFGIEGEWQVGYTEAKASEAWLRWKDEFVKRRALKRTVDNCSR